MASKSKGSPVGWVLLLAGLVMLAVALILWLDDATGVGIADDPLALGLTTAGVGAVGAGVSTLRKK